MESPADSINIKPDIRPEKAVSEEDTSSLLFHIYQHFREPEREHEVSETSDIYNVTDYEIEYGLYEDVIANYSFLYELEHEKACTPKCYNHNITNETALDGCYCQTDCKIYENIGVITDSNETAVNEKYIELYNADDIHNIMYDGKVICVHNLVTKSTKESKVDSPNIIHLLHDYKAEIINETFNYPYIAPHPKGIFAI